MSAIFCVYYSGFFFLVDSFHSLKDLRREKLKVCTADTVRRSWQVITNNRGNRWDNCMILTLTFTTRCADIVSQGLSYIVSLSLLHSNKSLTLK